MRHVNLRAVAAALLVLAAAIGIAACAGGERRVGGRHQLDLKIGDLVPLSGAQEALGLPGQKAANLAMEEIHKAIKETKAKHTVTINHQNYRSTPQLAVDQATKLEKDGYSCLAGPYSAGDLIPLATAVTVPKKVLEITPAATTDAIAPLEIGGYVNRTVAPDSLQGQALAQVMDKELGGAKRKRVSIGVNRSVYGEGLLKSFSAAWKKLGGRISTTVFWEPNLPDYKKEAARLVAPNPDAFVFFDFQDTYIRVATDLLKTKKWTPKKSFATDSLAISTLAQGGGAILEGLRGVAPGDPRSGPSAQAFQRLYAAGGPPRYRQSFDAQNFDAVVLCYLSAVAAGSTKGSEMKQFVRRVSAPPGTKYTWQQLPEAIKALEAGQEIDYQGASGPIDMNGKGNPTAGFYDVYRFKDARLALYGSVSVPADEKGLERLPLHYITPRIPGATPPPKPKVGATGASGATGAKGAKQRARKKTSRKGR